VKPEKPKKSSTKRRTSKNMKRDYKRRWQVPRMWPEEDVAIIGGGPSFAEVDRERLKALSIEGKLKVIGINKAYKEVPDSHEWFDCIFWGDDSFYRVFSRRAGDGIHSFPGLRVTCANPPQGDTNGVHHLGRAHRQGPGITSDKKHLISWNANSGFAAINLAYHLTGPGGRVFLFGFDMKLRGEEMHWHGGYHEMRKNNRDRRQKKQPPKMPFRSWLENAKAIKRDANKLGLKLFIVACPDSAIEEFKKIPFETFVEMVEEKHGQTEQSLS